MAKLVADAVLDAALDEIAEANLMVALPSEPASYAAAQSAKLAEVAMAGGDFTKANGDTSGRKTTVAAKAGVTVLTPGTATHVALLDTANSVLLYVTTTASTSLPAGTVDFGSWAIEIRDPA